MTALEAMHKADILRPNDWPESIKLTWVENLESDFRAMVKDRHFRKPKPIEDFYEEHDCSCDELIVPDPLSECYVFYLMAMIDNANADSALYQDDMALANSAIKTAREDYFRKHHVCAKNWRIR